MEIIFFRVAVTFPPDKALASYAGAFKRLVYEPSQNYDFGRIKTDAGNPAKRDFPSDLFSEVG